MKDRLVLHEADVDGSVHDLPGNFIEAATVDADFDLRKLAEVPAQRAGQKVNRCRLVGGDSQMAGREVMQFADLPHRIIAQLQHPLGIFDDGMTGFRQSELGHVPRE